jgi:hypothetical protein
MKNNKNILLDTLMARIKEHLDQPMTEEEKKLEQEIEQVISSSLSPEDRKRLFDNLALGLHPAYTIENGKIVVPKYEVG